ncbi:MAG: U32 family peptidase [Planctomycetes bacterium]|nr:U32 family peptidase [Planctomycetota bacterium]
MGMASNATTDRRPELLAPAGGWAALRAAAANGADAVYFGLQDFNARLRAANFTDEELPDTVGYLHDHNVKGYVTLNTLVFADELALAAERLKAIAEAGADAVIVQDLGLVPLIRRLAPSLPIHASTQMSLAEAGGIELVRGLGVRRVILARELPLADIRRIAGATEAELEVFVHGALCISFSGQCCASLALGGRSGNRGLCAQPCRLPYRVLADAQPLDTGECRYPLSPNDLATYDRLADLVAAGVTGFKIEGRLKDAHYVAAAVRVYRAALDAAAACQPFHITPEQEEELAQGFSRGFTRGYLDGVRHGELVVGRSPKGRGMRVGEAVGRTPRGIAVALAQQARVRPGDGVVFDAGPEETEQGGRLMAIEPGAGQPGRVVLVFRRGDVRLKAIRSGTLVWKTDDPDVRARLEQTYARDTVARPAPLDFRVSAALAKPLHITAYDDAGRTATAASSLPMERAERHPLTLEVLREQLGRLGGTPFVLRTVEAEPLDPVMAPKSVLNDLRRQAVERLLAQRRAAARHAIAEPDALGLLRMTLPAAAATSGATSLYVLVRSLGQLHAVLGGGMPRPAMVYGDFADPAHQAEAVARARAAGAAIGLATPRVIKPGEEDALQAVAEAGPDAVLVRNLAALAFFRGRESHPTLVGDFSLNAANDLAASVLLSLGIARVTPGLDVGAEQFAAMLRHADPARFEAIVHHHVPMFHTQHCLFAARLARGRGRGECGRPCRRARLALRDRKGAEHPVLPDAACRNTVFHAAAQAAEAVGRLRGLGLRHFRIELLDEGPREAKRLLARWGQALAIAGV